MNAAVFVETLRCRWSTHGRLIVQAVVALLTVVLAVADGHVTGGEWQQIALSVAAAVLVWLAPNLPTLPGVKTGVAGVMALLNAVVTCSTTPALTQIAAMAVAILGAGAVGFAPSQGTGAASEGRMAQVLAARVEQARHREGSHW